MIARSRLINYLFTYGTRSRCITFSASFLVDACMSVSQQLPDPCVSKIFLKFLLARVLTPATRPCMPPTHVLWTLATCTPLCTRCLLVCVTCVHFVAALPCTHWRCCPHVHILLSIHVYTRASTCTHMPTRAQDPPVSSSDLYGSQELLD